jgi:hypothetical protein
MWTAITCMYMRVCMYVYAWGVGGVACLVSGIAQIAGITGNAGITGIAQIALHILW